MTAETPKRRKPPATGQGPKISTRLHDDLLVPLDMFIEQEGDIPSRPEAVRRILRKWFQEHGRLASRAQHEIRPEDLNASNDD